MDEFYKNIDLAFKHGVLVENIYKDDCYKTILEGVAYTKMIFRTLRKT